MPFRGCFWGVEDCSKGLRRTFLAGTRNAGWPDPQGHLPRHRSLCVGLREVIGLLLVENRGGIAL